MSRTWVDKIDIGDLVFSKQDGKPAIVLDKQETGRAKYGDIANKRWRFKLYIDNDQGWLSETSFRALYRTSRRRMLESS